MSFDLSKVMFIATANYLDPIPPALKDRLELLELPGYTRQEKLAIARRFLVPKQIGEHGLKEAGLTADFTDEALLELIDSYTREAGVRNLEREVSAVIRGIAVGVVEGEISETFTVDRGPGQRVPRTAEVPARDEGAHLRARSCDRVWPGPRSAARSCSSNPRRCGARARSRWTGRLGDVMKESAQAALS